jgi:splicing factor 3A subunit 1
VNPQTDEYLISPITGERIPASKVQEHMRIGLLDPRWVEQRDRHLKDRMNNDTVYAPGKCPYDQCMTLFANKSC